MTLRLAHYLSRISPDVALPALPKRASLHVRRRSRRRALAAGGQSVEEFAEESAPFAAAPPATVVVGDPVVIGS